MKKILFAALLVAGTTLGFAKGNVKNEVEIITTTISSTKETKQTVKNFQVDSLEEAFKKGTCMDVHAFYNVVTVEDANGGSHKELEFAGSMEVTYECDNAQISLYIWY